MDRTRPLNEADLDIKVLNAGPPKSGVRIINRVYRQPLDGTAQPDPGIKVQINGPGGSTFTNTDARCDLPRALPSGFACILEWK
jgi:hypothetical protein